MTAHDIVEVAAFDCDVIEAAWSFEAGEADAIERNWRRRIHATPEIFDGRVLLLHHGHLTMDRQGRPVFRGACFETSYKAFLAWRDSGFPSNGVRNCFGMAALQSADGAFVLGEMAPHTAPAGQIYFPAGTPDRQDVIGGKLDLDGSARRELQEETGLDPDALLFDDGLTLVMDPARVCCMKRVRSALEADALVAGIHAWLVREAKPELTRMHIIREAADITPAVPAFVAAYLRWALSDARSRP